MLSSAFGCALRLVALTPGLDLGHDEVVSSPLRRRIDMMVIPAADLETDLADLSELSLAELRTTNGPVLRGSVARLVARTEHAVHAVLENNVCRTKR